MMSEMTTSRISEGFAATPTTETTDNSTAEMKRRDVETLEKARRWTQAITAAEHKAIYGSSVRDISGWREREDRLKAS